MATEKTLNADIVRSIKSYASFMYYVTQEEDKFLRQIYNELPKRQNSMWVYNSTMGLLKLKDYFEDWENRKHKLEAATVMFAKTMSTIYQAESDASEPNFYFILDPEKSLDNSLGVREVLNVIHQCHQNPSAGKFVIFVSNRKFIPDKLQRYIEVIYDKGLSAVEVEALVRDRCGNFRIKPPKDVVSLFRGLTSYEVHQAISRSVAMTLKNEGGASISEDIITEYKRKQFQKSDLIQYVDTSKYSFAQVGGLKRFQSWAKKNYHCWTKEGQAFGLTPPRGILLVGVYGCGKSLVVKALANSWKLPLVQFDMAKLRSSLVGDTEANVYKALQIIESAGPCLVYIDEAEKGLAGAESSGSSDSGTTARALGILSTWLQESQAPACFVMTSNSVKGIPPELINRMTERFFVDLPDELDRIDILKIHLAKCNQDSSKYQLAKLAEVAKGLVGREIEQVISAAMVESFAAGLKHLDAKILEKELTYKPRIIKTMVDEIQGILNWVGYDAELDDGVRAKLASDRNLESVRYLGK